MKGVYLTTKKDGTASYRAGITHLGKHISLGSFSDCKSAAAAYRDARMILETPSVTLTQYARITGLCHSKFVCLINLRDNGIYFKTPIYLRRQYFEYYLSESEILKFDRDDLFFYASRKIQKKGGSLFVSDYGSQYGITAHYGIRPFSVYGRDYRMVNGDRYDFRYSNIRIINTYAGVQREELPDGHAVYRTKIHINGHYLVGVYPDEITAAIAYNKAADTLASRGICRSYARNYIESMSSEEYKHAYRSISISDRLQAVFSRNS